MSSKRVLVVDDEPFILRSLTFVLRKEGFEVSEAENGEELAVATKLRWQERRRKHRSHGSHPGFGKRSRR